MQKFLKKNKTMKKKLISVLKITVFFSIGILFFYLAYRGQDFSRLFDAMKDTNWGWVLAVFFLGLLGHYSRAMRWSLMLEPLGYKPRRVNLFTSILTMYLSNMAIPRSGEFIRCGLINRYEKIPFTQSLGTVVTERVADMLVFLILTVIVLLMQSSTVSEVLSNNPDIKARLVSIENYIPYIIIAGIVLVFAAFFVVKTVIKKNLFSLGEKIKSFLTNLKAGVLSVLGLKKRWQFLFHTLFINLVYYLDTYLTCLAFPFTENISPSDALAVFVLSTYGVVVPSPGGMGTWHFLTIELLALYGVAKDPCGRAYALVTHGVQDISFLTVGFALLLLLPVINKKYSPQNENIPNA